MSHIKSEAIRHSSIAVVSDIIKRCVDCKRDSVLSLKLQAVCKKQGNFDPYRCRNCFLKQRHVMRQSASQQNSNKDTSVDVQASTSVAESGSVATKACNVIPPPPPPTLPRPSYLDAEGRNSKVIRKHEQPSSAKLIPYTNLEDSFDRYKIRVPMNVAQQYSDVLSRFPTQRFTFSEYEVSLGREHACDNYILRPYSRYVAFMEIVKICGTLSNSIPRVLDIYGCMENYELAELYLSNVQWVFHFNPVTAKDYSRMRDRRVFDYQVEYDPERVTSYILRHDDPDSFINNFNIVLFQDVQQDCASRDYITKLTSMGLYVVCIVHLMTGYAGSSGYNGYFIKTDTGYHNYPHLGLDGIPYNDTQGYSWAFECDCDEHMIWSRKLIYNNIYVLTFESNKTGCIPVSSPLTLDIYEHEFPIMNRISNSIFGNLKLPTFHRDEWAAMGHHFTVAGSSKKKYLVHSKIYSELAIEFSSKTAQERSIRDIKKTVDAHILKLPYYSDLMSKYPREVERLSVGTSIAVEKFAASSMYEFTEGIMRLNEIRGFTVQFMKNTTSVMSLLQPYFNPLIYCYRTLGSWCNSGYKFCKYLFYAGLMGNPFHRDLEMVKMYSERIDNLPHYAGPHLYDAGIVQLERVVVPVEPISKSDWDPKIKAGDVTCLYGLEYDKDGRLRCTKESEKHDHVFSFGPVLCGANYIHKHNNWQTIVNDALLTQGPDVAPKIRFDLDYKGFLKIKQFDTVSLSDAEILAWASKSTKRALYTSALSLIQHWNTGDIAKLARIIEVKPKSNEVSPKNPMKVRSIACTNPKVVVAVGPFVDAAQQNFYELFSHLDEPFVYKTPDDYSFHAWYGGCFPHEEEQDKALGKVFLGMQNMGTNSYHVIVSGDDAVSTCRLTVDIAGRSLPLDFHFESDMTAYDRSLTGPLLDISYIYLQQLGLPSGVADILRSSCGGMLVSKSDICAFKIDQSKAPRRRSGTSDTSLGNSILRIHCEYWFFLHIKDELSERTFDTPDAYYEFIEVEYFNFMKTLGLTSKVIPRDTLLHCTFLKGNVLWAKVADDVHLRWIPSFAKVLKLGTTESDPNTITGGYYDQLKRHPKRRYEACILRLREVLNAYRNYINMPFFSALCQCYARIDTDVPMDSFFKVRSKHPVEVLDWEPMLSIYGLDTDMVDDCHNYLQHHTPGIFVDHLAFRCLYSEYGCKVAD